MTQSDTALSAQAHIDALVRSTGAADPVSAIRSRAKTAIQRYRSTFGEPSMPINMDALASLLGIGISDQYPGHSQDAELVPATGGRVSIRVNPDRPETRKRFSVGHEISHTFFPNYEMKMWCRTDARYRRRGNPDDLLEALCDIGSAELLMPVPWFLKHAADVTSGAAFVSLAQRCAVSREAALRRYAELHSGCVAAVFLSWKLKPIQRQTIGCLDQRSLFGTDPVEEARRAKKLRIDYLIPSLKFADDGYYLPKDKSVQNNGLLYDAASTGKPCEGECHLNIGPASGHYRVIAVPVWTDDDDVGPDGENSLGAIIEPIDVKPASRGCLQSGPQLFD